MKSWMAAEFSIRAPLPWDSAGAHIDKLSDETLLNC